MAQINKTVEVQARTTDGEVIPMLITWRRRTYNVAKIVHRRRLKSGDRERIKVNVVTWRNMVLEYNYSKQSWTLLSADDV